MLRAVSRSTSAPITVTAVPFAPDTISTDGNVSLSGANIVDGVVRTGLSDGATDTFPTATALVAAVSGAVVNQTFAFNYINTTGFPVTLNNNSGITFSNTSGGTSDSIAAGNQVVYQVKLTNIGTPAVTVTREWAVAAGS